ncbi:Asp-tRNA(Asn)/Glu-tRNA(Gln) amidotransferase subunit GatB [Alkaliphilus sp. MSJ-5]|uniref:Aspartyl/glutamyl-tRNA(Asn/Gln) amidotransferase subunit B n=1 Tax=Alkaliphilus flagellatus TaxID=2841507 RepID=A0ABS6G9G5_9FIRM|nr:Asp-tRNA(Asn)/Glu-tRNA(Gln) amidotransferase subunit GatB [Alkaliphilus flagellatus]MBU5678030.1 Asp-tRNA(Asn)/Glu-tRNA(Gln) amidotransferase subunit GatB [Alkaliphilus flagellatus]
MNTRTIIGLEIHVELSTKSKIFCSCSTDFGSTANSQCCPICIGMPGSLPTLNKKVVDYAVKAGLALNCNIARESKMDRKNYFYPDLVKGYQITQYDKPLCKNGFLKIGQGKNIKKIGIKRIHIEEDTGKSLHTNEDVTLLDYNRSGVPLIEIVTEPDLSSAEETKEFLESLRDILKYIGISDVKMEEGSLRCDVNINVATENGKSFSNITELKNLNSFKSVVKAIEFEENRHRLLLQEDKNTSKETRRWDDIANMTISMRSKETEDDYRYFLEPDIMNIALSEDEINKIKETLPELPRDKRERWATIFKLPEYDINILTSFLELANFFEETMSYYNSPKKLSNWIMTELLRRLKEEEMDISQLIFTPKDLAELLDLIDKGVINNFIGKKVFIEMINGEGKPKIIAEKNGWIQIEDIKVIDEVLRGILRENPQSVYDYRNGKDRAFGYLVGQSMKALKGKGNPQLINKVLKKLLEE